MAVTQNTYTGNGSTTNYSLTFQYLEEDEIKVSLNGTLTTAYTLANATTISFTTAPANGVAIRIYRDTDVDTLQSTFFAGSAIRAQDLNDNFLQSNYSVQEIKDRFLDRTGGTLTGALDAGGFKITNVGTPTNNADASTKAYVDSQVGSVSASATAAAASASAAAASQSAAATSATNSANSATASASSASAALASQTAAASSASSASTSASNASTSASNAATSASNASTSATSASNSATSAASSAASALAAFDSFDDRYLGAKASDPTVDNDGDPLNAGDLYYNTTGSVMKVYTGSVWVTAYVPGDAASISFSPYSTTASNNVQGAVQELTDEKLNLSGGTLTGALNVTNGAASTPSVVISGDSATGLYSPGYGQVALSTTGAGRLFINTTGQVGIGTSSFNAGLLLQTAGGIGSGIGFLTSGTANVVWRYVQQGANDGSAGIMHGSSSARDFYIKSDGGGSANLLVDGKVGVGSTTLIERFHVNGGVRLDVDNQGLYFNSSTTSINGNGTSSYITFNTSNVEKARLDSSGRLLVGTSISTNTANTGSTQNIQVQGTGNFANISVIGNTTTSSGGYLTLAKSRSISPGGFTAVTSGDNLGGISFEGADGSNYRVGASISGVVDGTPGSFDMPGRLVFSVTRDGASSPTEAMRITSGGDTGVFHTGGGIQSASSTGAGITDSLFVGRYSATTPLNGTTSINIRTNGNVYNTNGTYTTLSDERLKENIVDATSQWTDIKGLRVCNFNFRANTGHETHKQLGLIAQEAEQICPGLVQELTLPGDETTVDAEGNELRAIKTVNMSVLYMKAVKALQEAMERIEQLETKVAALETP